MLMPTVMLTGMGLVSGLGLAVAARIFAVEIDPRQEKVADALPGANCGGCGLAGCNDFAAAVVKGAVGPEDCPVCDADTCRIIADIMGLTVEDRDPRVAMVFCQGSNECTHRQYRYNGLASCASAALFGGGDRVCNFGCLGLGDCQRVCTFGAVEMTEAGAARIIPARCTACGMCIKACPKDIIALVPAKAETHVMCSNHDRGAAAKRACSVGCIGCKKCEKFFDEDPPIKVSDFLAYVDYERSAFDEAVINQCPTGALIKRESPIEYRRTS